MLMNDVSDDTTVCACDVCRTSPESSTNVGAIDSDDTEVIDTDGGDDVRSIDDCVFIKAIEEFGEVLG